jgi:hypothetical protein
MSMTSANQPPSLASAMLLVGFNQVRHESEYDTRLFAAGGGGGWQGRTGSVQLVILLLSISI